MCFAIRREVGFQTYQQDLKGIVGIPIELALPYKLDEFLRGSGNLGALAAFVKGAGIICPSVHAPQGRITDDNFLSWARDVVLFAEAVGARSLVYHPESVRKDARTDLQLLAVRHIRQLQRETAVRIGIETFGNAKRVLSPEDVGERGLWMVLDTSHVFENRTRELIERYHGTIASIHLSEMREDSETGEVRPHMPVEGFGFEVLHLLQEKGWQGTVTLEYLPDCHNQLLPDRRALEELFPNV
jgi:sugar phosphate isomerase/epimerase